MFPFLDDTQQYPALVRIFAFWIFLLSTRCDTGNGVQNIVEIDLTSP